MLLLSAAPAGVGQAEPPDGDEATRLAGEVTRLADAFVAEYMTRFPDSAELSGLTLTRHDGLGDNTLAALAEWQALEDQWAEEIERIDAAALRGRPEWITYGFLREAVESSRRTRVCRYELWPVNQLSGWQSFFSQLESVQPVGTDAARAEALARWSKLPLYLDAEVRNLQEGVRLGYTTPQPNVRLVIKQLDELLAKPVEQWPFHGPAERDGSTAFKAEWKELLSDRIAPAIERYRAYLRDQYLPKAREAIAITAHPDGAACYQASFRAYTTIERPASETYELGRKQVEQNLAAALTIGRKSLAAGDLESLVARITADRDNHFASREALLGFAQASVARARERLPAWFSRRPRADIAVEPYPAFLEREANDSYWPAAEDGSRPAKYMISLHGFEETTRSNAEITAFHESYPGHHLQLGLARERPAAHPITRLVGNSGFARGGDGPVLVRLCAREPAPLACPRHGRGSRNSPVRLDPRAGDRVHGGERALSARDRRFDRGPHRDVARTAHCVRHRRARVLRAARAGGEGARRALRHSRIPRRPARQRHGDLAHVARAGTDLARSEEGRRGRELTGGARGLAVARRTTRAKIRR
jgi:uncharacterized protein (DUF885 family)